MTRISVPAAELVALDALLHDDKFADLLLTVTPNDKSSFETAVQKVMTDHGITLTQSQLDQIFTAATDKDLHWAKVQALEFAFGRTDSQGKNQPRMG